MIEFLAVTGKRYPIKFQNGNIFVIVNRKAMITRNCYKTRTGYEICYGGHFIEGKLRIKAGRRVVPPARKAVEVEVGKVAYAYISACMEVNFPIWHHKRKCAVTGIMERSGKYYATLSPVRT